MTIIANPIYDSVFKFLMEDDRAAKVLLSALLKQEVHDLKMRRNEYTNHKQMRISLFRIDFSARIKNAAGKEQLVLIELQKTWLATETLRFRQYLGAQYQDSENVYDYGTDKGFGLPIISIYILGHKLGDLNEPVVYVRRRYLDYESREITEGVPDPFIESLTHDSIIVQIHHFIACSCSAFVRSRNIHRRNVRNTGDFSGKNCSFVGRIKAKLTSVGCSLPHLRNNHTHLPR